ncbi:endonuclease III-like protein 1 [Tribolium madens]|uniref:endonuclease III-like protein 1 n=1 Tax=Tribolium madens TaxID=41895 RepID=UPI001CF72F5A|nr:endonuclease III-like protein 1 [Tribolium madens]
MNFSLRKHLNRAPNCLKHVQFFTILHNLRSGVAVNVMEASPSQDNKTDLSRFKMAPKRKLSRLQVSETRNKSTKRDHITIGSREGPPEWEKTLANIREMRKNFDAPVDSMGCDKCQEESASPEVFRYQALLALMLSSQTKDQIVYSAMQKLQKHGCNPNNILATSDEKLGELIYPVGFWKTKVKYIKKTTEILKNDYNGDIPKTVEDLCKLPGVGPKMAHLCMKTAWNEVTGIGVDTHVHRISNRIGWVNTKTPEETRKSLQGWLPKDLWDEIGLLFVGFGQQICQPVKPQCVTCLNNTVCPFTKKGKK